LAIGPRACPRPSLSLPVLGQQNSLADTPRFPEGKNQCGLLQLLIGASQLALSAVIRGELAGRRVLAD